LAFFLPLIGDLEVHLILLINVSFSHIHILIN
jgi:hypothetical protein